MEKSLLQLPILLLTLVFLHVTQAQYYDLFQGIQQFFQPYQQQPGFINHFNDVNRLLVTTRPPHRRPEEKKKVTHNRFSSNPPIHQYEYVFSTTTTQKPSRKTNKPSSQSTKINRHFNTDIVFNEYTPNHETTTKRNKVTKTTVRPIKVIDNKYTSNHGNTDYNRRTTEKVNDRYTSNYGNTNNNRQTTEKENNRYTNHGNADLNRPTTQKYIYSNFDTPYENKRPNNDRNDDTNKVISSNRNPNVQNISPVAYTEYNNFAKPSTRKPEYQQQNNRQPEYQQQNNRQPEYQQQYNRQPEYQQQNNRQPEYQGTHNYRQPELQGTQNNRQPDYHQNRQKFGTTNSGFINSYNPSSGFNDNYDRNRFPNNRVVLNTDYDGDTSFHYPGNPIINRPTKPASVNINPPITNRPTDRADSYGHTESADSPQIFIGPDEDDMTDEQKWRYINMAERMCDRYKGLSVKELVALPLLPSPDPVEFNVSSCAPITVPLVIGGKVATINEFPHMALVGWRKMRDYGFSWKCGGSLISDKYVLTAGHCTYQEKDYDVDSGPPQAVQLGSSYLDDPGALVVKISAVIRHPKYKQRRSYYDIALIKLSQTVTFSEVIRPACLGTPPPVGENIVATGWGRTEFGGDNSQELRTVSLPVWNMGECREIWGTSLKLPNGPTPESHVCAGDKRGGKDTCQGDSGGPAQIQDGCIWRIVAVTSYGRSCGAPNTPALYAVAKRAFIAAQVFGEEEGRRNIGRNAQYDDRPRYNDAAYENTRQPYSFVNSFRRQ